MATSEAVSAQTRLTRLTEVFVTFVIAGVLAGGFGGVISGLAGSATANVPAFLFTYLFTYGVLVGVAMAYIRIVQNPNALDLAPPTLLDVRDVLVGFLAVVLGVTTIAIVAGVTGLPVIHEGALGEPIGSPLILTALPLSLLIGVPAQELLFRNGFQKRLDERFPTWVAVGLPSILMVLLTLATFAGAPPLALLVPALAVALASNAVGWVYARSGTVVAAWLLHAALTVTLLSLLYLDASTAVELSSIA